MTWAVTKKTVLELAYEKGANEQLQEPLGRSEPREDDDMARGQDGRDSLARTGCYVNEESDLKRFLQSQFWGIDYEPEVMDVLAFLIGRLNKNGYLEESVSELAALSG